MAKARRERGYHSDTAEDNLSPEPTPIPKNHPVRALQYSSKGPLAPARHPKDGVVGKQTLGDNACHPATGRICHALDSRLGDFHSKGLSIIPIVNLKTGQSSRHYVGYRRSAKDRPLVLNYCPWCRADLRLGIEVKKK